MKNFVDFIYTALIGIGVALVVGLGIWTFYSGPKFPTYPNYPSYINNSTSSSTAVEKQYQLQQKTYEDQVKAYDAQNKSYSRTVSIIALITGLAFFGFGLWFMKINDTVAEGLSLGGIFSGVYSIGRSTLSGTKALVFGTALLLLAMMVGLVLFRSRFHKRLAASSTVDIPAAPSAPTPPTPPTPAV